MSTQIIIILQITVLLIVLLVLARIGVRWPRWASAICLAGLAICSLVVVLGTIGIEKPFEITLQQPDVPASGASYMPELNKSALVGKHDAHASPAFALQTIRRGLASLANQPGGSGPSTVTWCACIACLAWAALMCMGHLTSWRTLRGSKALTAPEVLRLLEQSRSQLGLKRSVTLRVHQEIFSPCVTWLFPRTIYVPAGFCGWTRAEQQAALAHELTHVKYLDVLTRLSIDLALLAVAWHPLAWLVRRQAIELQELATDSVAAKAIGGIDFYRRCLSRLLLRMDAHQKSLVSVFSVSFSTNKVVRRIRMLNLVSVTLPKWRLACSSAVLASMAVMCVAWGIRAEDPPRVASLPKLKAGVERAHDVCRPWETVCPSNGYFVLRSGKLVKMPAFRTALKQFFTSEQAKWPTDLASTLVYIEGNLEATISVAAEPQEDGRDHSLMLGANSFDAKFADAIDWAALSSDVRWQAFGTKEQMQHVVKVVKDSAASASFHAVAESCST